MMHIIIKFGKNLNVLSTKSFHAPMTWKEECDIATSSFKLLYIFTAQGKDHECTVVTSSLVH